MNYLLTNATSELNLSLTQSVLGCTADKIKKETAILFKDMQMFAASDHVNADLIMEIRVKNGTLTCYIDKNNLTCHTSYLFPDKDELIEEYTHIFNEYYLYAGHNHWINKKKSVHINIIYDLDVGHFITCKLQTIN